MARIGAGGNRLGTFRVSLFGRLALQRDGIALPVDTWYRPVRELFVLLVIAPDHRRLRDDVIDLLWPDATPAAGAANLRSTLRRLREALGGGNPPPVWYERGWLQLSKEFIWCIDLQEFEEQARSASGSVEGLRAALNLARGEPLEGERYEDWAQPARDRLLRLRMHSRLELAEALVERGEADAAVETLDEVLGADPFNEAAMGLLVRALSRSGKRADALRRSQQFARLLHDDLGLAPGRALQALIHGIRDETEPAARTTHGSPTGLVTSYPLPPVGWPIGARQRALAVAVNRFPFKSQSLTTPHLVLIGGEVGMGKSTFLSGIAEKAKLAGLLVLAAGCFEHEGRLPYGPLHDVLADYFNELAISEIVERYDDLLDDLAQVVPELHRRVPHRDLTRPELHESLRLRVYSAVAQALDRIAQDRGLVLLLDNLHWADDATMQLLHFVLRYRVAGATVIFATYRSEDISATGMLPDLLRGDSTPRADRIDLSPLESEDLALLLEAENGAVLSADLVTAIGTRSGGNPFFSLQILRLLRSEDRLEHGESGWQLREGMSLGVPSRVLETVARRIQRLSAPTRSLLAAASVLGSEVNLSVLEAMWEGSSEDLATALDEAHDAMILREIPDGLAYRHILLRDAVYAGLSRHRLAILHGRAGRALEARYEARLEDHAAELARHFVAAQEDEPALKYSLMAGSRAYRAFDSISSERHYQTALDIARRGGTPSTEADVETRLGFALRMAGRFEGAIAVLDHAASRHRELGDFEAEARCVSAMMAMHYAANSFEQGSARLHEVLTFHADRSPSPGLALLHVHRCWELLARSNIKEYLAVAQEAVAMAHASGDPYVIAQAEMHHGFSLTLNRRFDEGLRHLERAEVLADRLDDPALRWDASINRGVTLLHAGRLAEARRQFEKTLHVYRQIGNPTWIVLAQTNVARTCMHVGEWRAARESLEQALALAASADDIYDDAFPMLLLADLEVAEGRFEVALEWLDRVGGTRGAQNVPIYVEMEHSIRAEIDRLQGNGEGIVQRYAWLQQHPAMRIRGRLSSSVFTWGFLLVGDLEQAEVFVREGLDYLEIGEDWGLALGAVYRYQGRFDEARHELEDALFVARETSLVYREGRVLVELGELLFATGDIGGGRTRLTEALGIFERLGASPYAEIVRAALARVPEQPPALP